MRNIIKRYTIYGGLALGSIGLANANTIVTFQVDMTQQIANSAFVPGVNVVYARGSFNGFGTFLLTNNPAAANTNLYTGVVDDTTDANGALMAYKFCIDAGGWETGNDRQVGLPTTSGASFLVPSCYFNDQARTDVTVSDNVTFQVDMTQQTALGNFTPGVSVVSARGGFNGWGTTALTNDPGGANTNLYSMTVSQTDAPINLEHFKFYIDTGANWENPSIPNEQGRVGDLNRYYNMLDTSGDIVLPVVYFSDLPPAPPITNSVTFQVDMSIQAAIGHFTPGVNTVQCRGSFNNWADGAFTLTNDPVAVNSNLYSGTVTIITPPTGISYKFWDSSPNAGNTGYESPASTGGGNRSYTLSNTTATITVPAVYYADLTSTANFLTEDTLVTFSVNMTGAVTTAQVPFNPGSDSVYVNGDWIPWWGWDNPLQPWLPYQLTNNPVGTELYSCELLIPKGTALALTYKYSINGSDNELAAFVNHIRYIRQTGNYQMALDKFGTQVIEPAFGQLTVGSASGGTVPVSWLGLPAVQLETRPSLSSGSWLALPQTDGTNWVNGYTSTNGFVSVTNYPTSSPQTYFRLMQLP